jgi:hypothetical protein
MDRLAGSDGRGEVGFLGVDGGAFEDKKRGEGWPATSASVPRGIEIGWEDRGMSGTNRFMSDAFLWLNLKHHIVSIIVSWPIPFGTR